MPQGNLKTPAKKSSAAIVPVIVKKPAAKKAAATPAKSKTTSKAAAPAVAKQPTAEKRTTLKKPGAKAAKGNGQTTLTPEQRFQMICDAAYYRAERRGFVGGNPHEDWLAAEAEIDAMIKGIH